MKSSNAFFLVAMAGIAIMAEPAAANSVKQRKHTPRSSTVKNIKAKSPGNTAEKLAARKLAYRSLDKKEFLDKETLFDKVLIWYPEDEKVLAGAIRVYELEKKAEKAIPLYNKLLAKRPDDVLLNIRAAKAYFWTKRYAESVKCYEAVINAGHGYIPILKKYADALYEDQQYDLAAAQYRALLEKNEYRNNSEEIINKLFRCMDELNATKYSTKADKLFEYLVTSYPDHWQVKMRKLDREAQKALAKGDFAEALRLSYEALKIYPDHAPSLLRVARISSWKQDYKTSLDNYDKLISGNSSYEKPMALREKARVLGWMALYDKAVAGYEDAVNKYPENKAIASESKAKNEYYRNSYRTALPAYLEWTKSEPTEPEARFDLGQLYMQHGKWNNAADIYDKMADADTLNLQVPKAKEKTNILSSMTQLRSGTEYFRIDSGWKNINLTSTSFYTGIASPLNERLTGILSLDTRRLTYEKSRKSFDPETLTAGVEYRNSPDIVVRTAYNFHKNYPDLTDSHTAFIETASEPLNDIHLALAYRHEDVMDNAATFISRLQRNRMQGRVLYDGYRRWNAGADYDYGTYSDGNRSVTAGADITTHLLFGRDRLNFTYRLQNYGFTDMRDSYWTPSSFTTSMVGVELRHYFNEELFMGVDDTYYTVSYKAAVEPTNNVSHQIHAELYHDWSRRLSSSIEGQYSWATKAFYQDKLLKAEIRWFF